MNRIDNYPVWNGLIYGSYSFIVCRLKKIENSNRYFWIALYNIEKRINHLCKNAEPWMVLNYKNSSPFLFRNNAKYVILQFSSNEIKEDYYQEPEVDILDKEELFFENFNDTVTYLNNNKIELNWFTPPHTKEFPLNHTTWNEYSTGLSLQKK
ncbi:MAG: hypothetical protein EAZ85_15490 [Bacteroidetes bacterium]|nr:MAG: hypothetical protein EAZ85_15490 [Bacteroidota bacterium]